MGRLEDKDEDDQVRDQFIADLLAAANGRPITQTAFTLAHYMWHADGIIRPGVFGSKADQLRAMNEDPNLSGGKETSIIDFIRRYLDQKKLDVNYPH